MKKKKKTPKITYFFLDGVLHKRLQTNRAADLITAWDFRQAKVVKHSLKRVKTEGQKAFTTKQVSEMISRDEEIVRRYIWRGQIKPPQAAYAIEGARRNLGYYWTEEDIMGLHDYLKTVHRGRPRSDGIVIPQAMPTASELRAMIRQGTVFYVKDESGNFVPTWDAEKF